VDHAPSGALVLRTSEAEFELAPSGDLKGSLLRGEERLTLDSPITEAEDLRISGRRASILLDLEHGRRTEESGKLGSGVRVEVTGRSEALEKALVLEVFDDFPTLALLSVAYRNTGARELVLDHVRSQRHRFAAPQGGLWSFSGASVEWGKDDVFPLTPGLHRANPVGGSSKEGYGGGIPVVAVWSASVGEAIGHLETLPQVVSIPLSVDVRGAAEVSILPEGRVTLPPGATYTTPRTFLSVYAGDFYEPLRLYSKALQKEGLTFDKPPEEAYQAAWCGWGYEFDVTPGKMLGTVPKLQELGIHWATLDDRWFETYGDWNPRPDTFPGDAVKEMVAAFHRAGIRVQIWWLPLGAEDGHNRYESHAYKVSRVVSEHPDWLILDKSGRPARVRRGLAALCPALPEVREYLRRTTERFIRDWDMDGNKLDESYSVPPCYNPRHHHRSPQDSVDAVGEVFRLIHETSRSLKPESVTQICSCGTPPSLAWLNAMDQAVTADPVGSVQVRRRLGAEEGLQHLEAAVYGDHVELTKVLLTGPAERDLGEDFASTVGLGGVVGTKFVWPDPGPHFKDVYLNAEKDARWKKWLALYNSKMLSQGTFLNLYTYGFDSPEAYAVRKDGLVYYAFFSASPFRGEIELRGLPPGRYRVRDYVLGRDLGEVDAARPRLRVDFERELLLEAGPL
jgi:alpha-galactosidase